MNDITIVKEKTFETIKSAVNQLVDTIRPTFGPASNKVIIDSPMYFNPLAVDDGVQIARDFKLENPAENAIVKLVKETAIKTNDRAGDGTTGALIILQAIINEVARKNRIEGRKIELERESLEEPRPSFRAVEVEVGRELFRLLVEDVETPVEVVDEKAASTRLISKVVHSGELRTRVGVRVVRGNRKRGIILQFQHQPRW